MSVYTDKIENHAVHANLELVQNHLEELKDMLDRPLEDREAVARISFVIKNFEYALQKCEKNLISLKWLDEVSTALNNVKSYIMNYNNTKDKNYLIVHAFGQLDIILQNTVKLNTIKSKQTLRGVQGGLNEYAKVMDLYNKELAENVSALKKEIEQLRIEIGEHEKTIQKNKDDFAKTITTERQRLDGFATSYQSQMSTDQKEFLNMTNSFKETFSASEETRKKDFEFEIKNIEEQQDKFENNWQDFINNYDEKFKEYQKQVEDIVGLLNSNVFSYKYKEVADSSGERAKAWHKITMLFIVLVGIFAVVQFGFNVNENTNWVKLVAKIFTTSTLVTGAAYAARQASKQEKIERYARKIEMELVAIDPFIQSIEEEKRSAIKEDLARKLFGDSKALEISSKEESYAVLDKLASMEEMIKNALGNMRK